MICHHIRYQQMKIVQKGTVPNCTIFQNDTKGDCPQLYYFCWSIIVHSGRAPFGSFLLSLRKVLLI